jgi:hypothetical protein
MKQTLNRNPVNLYLLALGPALALLCSCASTSVEKTWKAPDYQAGPLTKLAVLAVDDGPGVRRGFENRFANQIQKSGATASTTFNLISLPEINKDKPAAAARIRETGAEALVIIRLVDASSSYREMRPGAERYTETITGMGTGYWYDYYSVAFMDMGATYGSLKQKVFLETGVFDLKTAKRLWAGTTKTVVTESMDRAEEADNIVSKVVAAMQKDGVLP